MANTTHGDFHKTALPAVNEALTVLGQDVVLDELSTASKNAHSRKAAYLYDSARLRVLRDHPWGFAMREEETGGGSAASAWGGGEYPYSTALPGKCVRLVACTDLRGRPVRWRIVRREVRSDDAIGRMSYVYDEEDLDRWTPGAYRALVLRLAADLAKPITGRINERQLQEQAYRDQLDAAKLDDARENGAMYDPYACGNRYVDAMLRGEGDR